MLKRFFCSHNEEGITEHGWHWWLAIVLAGALLRLYAAYIQPLYADEVLNYFICQMSCDDMARILACDNHTPTLNILLWPLAQITNNYFILRLPVVICGIIAIAASYGIFREYFSERESLQLMTVVALGYHLLINDTMLRPYGPLTLGLVLTWKALSRIRAYGRPFNNGGEANTKWQWWLFFGLCLISSSLHMLGALALGIAILFALRLRTPERWYTIACLLAGMAPCVAWFGWRMVARSDGGNCGSVGDWSSLTSVIDAPLSAINLKLGDVWIDPAYVSLGQKAIAAGVSSSIWTDIEVQNIVIAGARLGGLALWLLLLWGTYRLWRRQRWAAGWLAGLVCGPYFVLGCARLAGKCQVIADRYMIPFTVPLLVLLLGAADGWGRKLMLRMLLAWSIVLALAFPFCPGLWTERWSEIIEFTDAKRQPGDIIAFYYPNAALSFAFAYDADNTYFEHYMLRQRPAADKIPWLMLTPQDLNEKMARYLQVHRLFLVVTPLDDSFDPGVVEWFEQHSQRTALLNFPNVNSYSSHCLILYEPN